MIVAGEASGDTARGQSGAGHARAAAGAAFHRMGGSNLNARGGSCFATPAKIAVVGASRSSAHLGDILNARRP
jgi:lipid A disaccharide synthetase